MAWESTEGEWIRSCCDGKGRTGVEKELVSPFEVSVHTCQPAWRTNQKLDPAGLGRGTCTASSSRECPSGSLGFPLSVYCRIDHYKDLVDLNRIFGTSKALNGKTSWEIKHSRTFSCFIYSVLHNTSFLHCRKVPEIWKAHFAKRLGGNVGPFIPCMTFSVFLSLPLRSVPGRPSKLRH